MVADQHDMLLSHGVFFATLGLLNAYQGGMSLLYHLVEWSHMVDSHQMFHQVTGKTYSASRKDEDDVCELRL